MWRFGSAISDRRRHLMIYNVFFIMTVRRTVGIAIVSRDISSRKRRGGPSQSRSTQGRIPATLVTNSKPWPPSAATDILTR